MATALQHSTGCLAVQRQPEIGKIYILLHSLEDVVHQNREDMVAGVSRSIPAVSSHLTLSRKLRLEMTPGYNPQERSPREPIALVRAHLLKVP